jgi:drug/metabolite transporter (DMT)-like permease
VHTDTEELPLITIYALIAAVGYGASDFLAGTASRRSTATQVAAVSQLGALVPTLAFMGVEGSPLGAGSLLPGLVAGVGLIIGCLGLYRGLAVGSMIVVAPLSALFGAAVPVTGGLLTGESLSTSAVVGALIAIPALLFVAGAGGTPSDAETAQPSGSGAMYGVIAGCGFGVMYLAYGSAGGPGAWPVLLSLLIGACVLFPMSRSSGGSLRPVILLAVVAGVVAGIAHLAFRLGATGGSTALTAVIASLYPAVTVLLAVTLLAEPLGKVRAAGLGLTVVAIALVSL